MQPTQNPPMQSPCRLTTFRTFRAARRAYRRTRWGGVMPMLRWVSLARLLQAGFDRSRSTGAFGAAARRGRCRASRTRPRTSERHEWRMNPLLPSTCAETTRMKARRSRKKRRALKPEAVRCLQRVGVDAREHAPGEGRTTRARRVRRNLLELGAVEARGHVVDACRRRHVGRAGRAPWRVRCASIGGRGRWRSCACASARRRCVVTSSTLGCDLLYSGLPVVPAGFRVGMPRTPAAFRCNRYGKPLSRSKITPRSRGMVETTS